MFNGRATVILRSFPHKYTFVPINRGCQTLWRLRTVQNFQFTFGSISPRFVFDNQHVFSAMIFAHIINGKFGMSFSSGNDEVFIGTTLKGILLVAIFDPKDLWSWYTLEWQVEFHPISCDYTQIVQIFGINKRWNCNRSKF